MVDIENAGLITDFWGEWPDFHDAELRVLRLESPPTGIAFVEATFDVMRFSPERDEHGYARSYHWARTAIRFTDAAGVIIDGGFSGQNVLQTLSMRERTEEERKTEWGGDYDRLRYIVDFVPIPGFCAISFFCGTICVLSVEQLAPAA